jgi:hypothetical protein
LDPRKGHDEGKRFTAEQIVSKLREAEVELAKGQSIAVVSKKLGITDQRTTDGGRSTAG